MIYLFSGFGFGNFIIFILLAIVCIPIGIKGRRANKPIFCPNCDERILFKEAINCTKCGVSLRREPEYIKCIRCGGHNSVQDEFCSHCGDRLKT